MKAKANDSIWDSVVNVWAIGHTHTKESLVKYGTRVTSRYYVYVFIVSMMSWDERNVGYRSRSQLYYSTIRGHSFNL